MIAAALVAFAASCSAGALELVEFSAPVQAPVSPMAAVVPQLPSAEMIPLPPAPVFAALDTREIAAARPVRSAVSAYLPAPLARLADGLVQSRQAKAARAQPTTVEEQTAFESLTKIHAALTSGDKQGAVEELETAFASKAARDWYARNEAFAGYQVPAAGFYRHVERSLIADRARAVARGKDSAFIAEAKRAQLNGSLLGRGHRPTAAQPKDRAWCAFHALCNAAGGSPEELVAEARRKLDRVDRRVDAHYGARLGLKARVAVSGGVDSATLAEVARLKGLELSGRPRVSDEEDFRAMIKSGQPLLLSLRLFHKKHAIAPEERAERGHDFEALHHAVSFLGAYPSEKAGAWLYMAQDSGSGTTDFYTWDELRGQVREIQAVNLP